MRYIITKGTTFIEKIHMLFKISDKLNNNLMLPLSRSESDYKIKVREYYKEKVELQLLMDAFRKMECETLKLNELKKDSTLIRMLGTITTERVKRRILCSPSEEPSSEVIGTLSLRHDLHDKKVEIEELSLKTLKERESEITSLEMSLEALKGIFEELQGVEHNSRQEIDQLKSELDKACHEKADLKSSLESETVEVRKMRKFLDTRG